MKTSRKNNARRKNYFKKILKGIIITGFGNYYNP